MYVFFVINPLGLKRVRYAVEYAVTYCSVACDTARSSV